MVQGARGLPPCDHFLCMQSESTHPCFETVLAVAAPNPDAPPVATSACRAALPPAGRTSDEDHSVLELIRLIQESAVFDVEHVGLSLAVF